jgi:HEPN domain-containing protein
MTPAEKADELIRKYYSIGAIEVKQCASIAVDEILYELDHIPASNETREYWEEVKQEIEKL